MFSKPQRLILFFSSLKYGGGRTFAETFIDQIDGYEIFISSLYDRDFTQLLAKQLNVKACNIFDAEFLSDKSVLLFSNSQITAAISSVLFAGRHYYVTHGYANGLSFAARWRQILYRLQVNVPGTRIVACGHSEYESLVNLCKDRRKITIIRNSLPPKIYSAYDSKNQALVFKDREISLVYIGRICFQKGLDILLDAIRNIQIDEVTVRLYIVGNFQKSENEYRRQIQEKLKNFPYKITILPTQDIDQNFYKRFSALVAPSRFEGLPYTILEAAYSGLPIILSNCAGNSDIIPNDSYGYTFTSGNPKSLTDAIVKFAKSTEVQNRNRINRLRSRVNNEFSPDSFKAKYLEIIEHHYKNLSHNS